jgi:hypothetical protein
MAGCRDCPECTETGCVALLMFPLRFVWILLTGWNIGLFVKKCPVCGHRMSVHQRRTDGSFRD